jgi:hypothetical protein
MLGKGYVVLQRCHLAFNPHSEPILKRHLWLFLLGLPLHLWTKEVLADIANTVGRFISVDEDGLFTLNRKMARVLLEFHVARGLLKEIDICWGSHVYVQKLDYRGIPFRCHLCRGTGHLRFSYPSAKIEDFGLEKSFWGKGYPRTLANKSLFVGPHISSFFPVTPSTSSTSLVNGPSLAS